MTENPFSRIVNTIREDNRSQVAASFRMGTVITVEPLMVEVAGNVQEREDLLKSGNLYLGDLEAGDRLLLVPIENEQRYIIVCKVVSV